ncbi:MAG: peptidoglycan DD-metalloendopeptidase family protein [Prevotella sp.]|nr:peptidoglycan DD-metalloendopeptidase family protein [Prevotella sp.]
MNRLLSILVCLLTLSVMAPDAIAQTSNTQKRTTTRSKTQASRKTTSKKTATRTRSTKKSSKKGKQSTTAVKETASIKGLKNESAQIKKHIKEQEQKLRSNEQNVKKRLHNLLVINTEIADKRKTIDTIRHDINRLDGNIAQLNSQIDQLNKELEERKARYIKSMRYMHRNQSIQSQLMFIFSAKNFTQMFRRMRFVREYASYQRAQGEMVKSKRKQLEEKQVELTHAKQEKNVLLNRGIAEHKNLENKQEEQQQVVKTLQKEQKTIQKIISTQKQKDAAINAQIDKLIAIEVEKARARAAAEAKRKAAAEAARKRAEELARKKAAAEAAARENARRIAEAKANEERLKAKAREAAKRSEEEKRAAEQAAAEAERARKEAEKKAAAEAKAHEKEMAEAKRESTTLYEMDSEDRRISGSFESNRGRLPMPVAGGYRIVSHFGQYHVEGLKNVTLDNKGINIMGKPGAQVRSIFDGEVSAVFSLGGTTGVMVRHGSYISVYCNLGSVFVHRGQKVSTRQVIGTVGAEHILQFQLRRETSKLNPEVWLGR